jgi:1,4-alpha-glucan branching enzyme
MPPNLARFTAMNTAMSEPSLAMPRKRYSAGQTRHRVTFFCDAPEAQSVRLVGDFNEWKLEATPLQRMPDGRWMVSLELQHGHHEYLFVVDGLPRLDPTASGTTLHEGTDPVSVVAVS